MRTINFKTNKNDVKRKFEIFKQKIYNYKVIDKRLRKIKNIYL